MFFICEEIKINIWINVFVGDFAVLPDILNAGSRDIGCKIVEVIG